MEASYFRDPYSSPTTCKAPLVAVLKITLTGSPG
jgi:hypothetical protein